MVRARRLASRPARDLYVASHALLRAALAERAGPGVAAMPLDATCKRCGHHGHGRPSLVPGSSETVEFSLSRTEGMVAVALSTVPIGIDVEKLGTPLSRQVLAQVLSPTEIEPVATGQPGTPARATGQPGRPALATGERGQRPHSDYEAWVAKEAVGKARSSGLIGMHEVPVSTGGAIRSRVTDGASSWELHMLEVGPAHVGALACPGGGSVISIHEAPRAILRPGSRR